MTPTQPVRLPPRGARWIGTSWKMNKTRAEAVHYARALSAGVADRSAPEVQPFVIPPATALAEVAAALGGDVRPDGLPILVGAQNAHWEPGGAWTGELSVPQVADAGAVLVEIGHSERRRHFAETDHTVNLKVLATVRHGLVPLVCVGEDADTAAGGGATSYVLAQVEAALAGVDDVSGVVLAYEPVWAIGEHGREARPDDVREVFDALATTWGDRVGAILYGGSVNAGNAADLLAVPGVDGLFVGRAAWRVEGFLELFDLVAS